MKCTAAQFGPAGKKHDHPRDPVNWNVILAFLPGQVESRNECAPSIFSKSKSI